MKRLLLTLLLCCSCSQSIEPRIATPTVVDNRERWKVVAMMIKERYETDMTVKDITEHLTAEAAYQEYLLSID